MNQPDESFGLVRSLLSEVQRIRIVGSLLGRRDRLVLREVVRGLRPIPFAARFFFSSRRRHTRCSRDWSSDVWLFRSAEVVVLAAGMWSREFAARHGVSLPLQAAEHFYAVTEPIEGLQKSMPFIRVPDESTYYKEDRKSTRLNSSHGYISYAVFCLKKK